MIPRLKPNFNHKEIINVFSLKKNAVPDFESKFAEKFKARYAVAFLYGRSGLYALLKCLGIKDSEIILPAYTCVVVAHAVVKSGNIPRFVDIDLDNFNMNLDMVEKAITPNTRAIIGTSLFGYPYDVDRLKEIIDSSGQGILLIQDCAHSFGVEFKNKLICNQGDAAIFGQNISKQISSIFGGMVTTNDDSIYMKLKDYRDREFAEPSFLKSCKQLLYFLSTYITFSRICYGFVNLLETKTPLLDRFTKYYEEDVVDMPGDFMMKMPAVSARVGIAQVQKYEENKKRRREIAEFYNRELAGVDGLTLPSLIDDATYSHYVPRVEDRRQIVEYMRKKGVQIGELIEYSIPHMKAYAKYGNGDYPNSCLASKTTINLPNYPRIRKSQLRKTVSMLKGFLMWNEKNKTTNVVKDKSDIVNFYNNYAQSWDQRFRANMSTSYFLNRRLDIIKNLADFSGDECVLEVGCGTAFHLFSLSEYFNNGFGVDISEKMLEMCTKNPLYLKQAEKLKFICDDAETLEKITSESIDVVFFVGLIEHLQNPLKFLENCRRILRPNGKLIGITPNRYSPWYNLIGPLVRKSMKHLSTDRYYSKSELSDMLSSTGFRDCTLNYWGFVPPGDFSATISSILRKCEIVAEKTFLRVLAGGLAIRAIKAKS